MVEVCYAWNHGLDGHSAERMTSENNMSYPRSRLGCFCGTALRGGNTDGKCRASKIEQPQTNHHSTDFWPRKQMDMVMCLRIRRSRLVGIPPLLNSKTYPALSYELPNLGTATDRLQ
jgi:hypothetical protein